jgi:hypothetical protein
MQQTLVVTSGPTPTPAPALATIPVHATQSGYTYLNLPKHLCTAFGIGPQGCFLAIYKDGSLILTYQKAAQ